VLSVRNYTNLITCFSSCKSRFSHLFSTAWLHVESIYV